MYKVLFRRIVSAFGYSILFCMLAKYLAFSHILQLCLNRITLNSVSHLKKFNFISDLLQVHVISDARHNIQM